MNLFRDPKFYCNLLLSVSFIAIFIAIFFFTYAAYIEQQIIIEQTKNLVNDFTDNIAILYPDNATIQEFVGSLNIPVSQSADDRAVAKNDSLIRISIKYLSIGASIALALCGLLIITFDLDWTNILIKNLIILCCVAVTEFFFLTFIAAQYISFDPNFVKLVVVNKLDAFKQSNISNA